MRYNAALSYFYVSSWLQVNEVNWIRATKVCYCRAHLLRGKNYQNSCIHWFYVASFGSNFDCTFECIDQIPSLSCFVASKTNTFVRNEEIMQSCKLKSLALWIFHTLSLGVTSKEEILLWFSRMFLIISYHLDGPVKGQSLTKLI